MSDLVTYRALLAWSQQRPLPLRETLSVPRAQASETLIVAFVRMAGEAMPWGFAVGHPGEEPRIFTVPEPRNLDLAMGLCLELARVLLPHVGHPQHGADVDLAARQVWLPGVSHVDQMHLLALRLTYAQKHAEASALRALGRAMGFLFRESSRPGQVSVVNASALLRELFVFPAEPSRCSHLGYQLAWLRTSPDRMAAVTQAELLTAGDMLDPALERDQLQTLVEAWGKAKGKARAQAERAIDALLRPELLRRWGWAEEAWWLVQQDTRPENAGMEQLRKLARDEHQWQYLRSENQLSKDEAAFVVSPETDHGAAATSRYFASIHAQEVSEASLLQGDASRQAEALAAGEIMAGRLVRIKPRRDAGPDLLLWTVEGPASDLCKLREGSSVSLAGLPGISARIDAMEVQGETRTAHLVLSGSKARIQDASGRHWLNKRVTLLPTSMPFFSKNRSIQAWKAEGPGAWLSHGGGAPKAGPMGDGASLLAQVRSLATKE